MRALFCLPQVENRFMGKDKRFRSKEGIFEESSSDLRCECECAGEKRDRGRCLQVFRNAALVMFQFWKNSSKNETISMSLKPEHLAPGTDPWGLSKVRTVDIIIHYCT